MCRHHYAGPLHSAERATIAAPVLTFLYDNLLPQRRCVWEDYVAKGRICSRGTLVYLVHFILYCWPRRATVEMTSPRQQRKKILQGAIILLAVQ